MFGEVFQILECRKRAFMRHKGQRNDKVHVDLSHVVKPV